MSLVSNCSPAPWRWSRWLHRRWARETAPWDLRERDAYVLDMQGKMWSTRVGDKGMAMMTLRAKAVPRGTVFFSNNGKLYMASSGMFDRAGGFIAIGGM